MAWGFVMLECGIFRAILVGVWGVMAVAAWGGDFDLAPFALPGQPSHEIRFEDPHEIERVVVTFAGDAPSSVGLSYMQRTWPHSRIESGQYAAQPMMFGWQTIDDQYNTPWKLGATDVERLDGGRVQFTFRPVSEEFPNFPAHTFRRTLGVRVEGAGAEGVKRIEVFTPSERERTTLRVQLDAGKPTPAEGYRIETYFAHRVGGDDIADVLPTAGARVFEVAVEHMRSRYPFDYDEGHVTFIGDAETFTISLAALAEQGPIWFEDQGVFITDAQDTTTFEAYRARNTKKNLEQMVLERREQTFGGARNGQPRAHPVPYALGVKGARQRFVIEPNGDLVLMGVNMKIAEGKDTPRFKNAGDGRFYFGMERWVNTGRFAEQAPVIGFNLHARKDAIAAELKTFVTPLVGSVMEEEKILGDDTMVCLLRVRLRNQGDAATVAEWPVQYSNASGRSVSAQYSESAQQDDDLVVWGKREALTVDAAGRIMGEFEGKPVLRAEVDTEMEIAQTGAGLVLRRTLKPGETCEAVLKIPYIAIEEEGELAALGGIDFARADAENLAFWRAEGKRGAQLRTAEPAIDVVYATHLAQVQLGDTKVPGHPEMISTSVGPAAYGNYSNEACMIIEDLDERGLHDEAEKRLDVYLKYQGTIGLDGNFTDKDGVFFGAGGFEMAPSYNQHHGWVLWCMARHYELSGDEAWLRRAAPQLIAGVDWVARQRKQTTEKPLTYSRGWEKGFLAAGGLEDVGDYFYWLSTNAFTWRGVEHVARALEAIGHPEAARVRAEADDYRAALTKGYETSRQYAPLVRLRDGRWVPHYPSRLYRRGRDVGWIREVLEGAIYLVVSGLFDAKSKQADWILDDYQENLYTGEFYGYHITDFETMWFDYAGFSFQPNLLAGLLPYLDRDEPAIYNWMFFNAFASCYREESNALIEHPWPYLGFSNIPPCKTSDQANSMKWLRGMYVNATRDELRIGQAIPKDWMRDGQRVGVEGAVTAFGEVSVEYVSRLAEGKIAATVGLKLRKEPGRVVLRFRHPEGKAMTGVTVNGEAWEKFDAGKGDVDLTGVGNGEVRVEARY